MSGADEVGELDTLMVEIEDHVACVTLNRPEVHNAFNQRMQQELGSVWQFLRTSELVRAVVLTGAGDKAFCTGIDRSDIPFDTEFDPYTYDDPGPRIGPKARGLWKPVIAAVNGIACGGAFYLLGECDIVVAADHATFFDPHVTYGMTASFEPMLLLSRMAFGDLVRMTLVGVHERISARTAREVGLVSEVLPGAELLAGARRLARVIASQPPASVQASLRTLWAARGLSPEKAESLGNIFLQLGTSSGALKEGQETFTRGRVEWRLR